MGNDFTSSKIAINELISVVEKCQNVLKSNKIFLVQCCRTFQESSHISSREQNSVQKIEDREIGSDVHFPSIRPVLSFRHNMIVICAGLPGYLAYRSPTTGSFLIQDFSEVILRSRKLASSALVVELRKSLQFRVKNGEFKTKHGTELHPMYVIEQYIGSLSSDFKIM